MSSLSAKLAASTAVLDTEAAERRVAAAERRVATAEQRLAAGNSTEKASIVLIKHQEEQQATRAHLASAKAGQQAKMRAKLAERKLARAEAAAQLAALASAVDETASEESARTGERSDEQQAQLEVMIEQANKRRDLLESQMIELGAEAAASEVEVGVAAALDDGGAGVLMQDVAAERADQAALTAQLAELSAKLAGALAALSQSTSAADAAADAKANEMDASAVLIKHQEAQDKVHAMSNVSRKVQQAKMQARLASRKAAREAAAAELAALQGALDATPAATTLEEEMAHEVKAESVQKKRDALLKQLAELDAEQAMAEIEEGSATAPSITGRSKPRSATEILLENTGGVGAPHQRSPGAAPCHLLFMLTRAILMPLLFHSHRRGREGSQRQNPTRARERTRKTERSCCAAGCSECQTEQYPRRAGQGQEEERAVEDRHGQRRVRA